MKDPKRLIFCTYSSIYSNTVLKSLLRSADIEVVAIITSSRNLRINESYLYSDIERIKQSGIHYAFYLWFVTTGYRMLSPFSRTKSVEKIAGVNGIPVFQTRNINEQGIIDIIRSLQPDTLLCAHFNQRVSPAVYSVVKETAMNIHPSLLPDLKGVDPAFYALLEDYSHTGVTIHELAENFDEGRIIAQTNYKIAPSESLFSLNESLFKLGINLFLESINTNQLVSDKGKPSRYDSWPNRNQVAVLRAKRKLI